MSCITSVGTSDHGIIQDIVQLHCPLGVHLDITYHKGAIYKNGFVMPRITMDKRCNSTLSMVCDAEHLAVVSSSIYSILCDLPFLARNDTKYGATKQYTGYVNLAALKQSYKKTLKESYRALQHKGVLIFKCQDVYHGKNIMIHALVHDWAVALKFKPIDIFIRANKNMIYNPNVTQRHARKAHSYYWVFKK